MSKIRVAVVILTAFILFTVEIKAKSNAKELAKNLLIVLFKHGKLPKDSVIGDSIRTKVSELVRTLVDKRKELLKNEEDENKKQYAIRQDGVIKERYKSFLVLIQQLLARENMTEEHKAEFLTAVKKIMVKLSTKACDISEELNTITKIQGPVPMGKLAARISEGRNSLERDKGFDAYSVLTALRQFVFKSEPAYRTLKRLYSTKCDHYDKSDLTDEGEKQWKKRNDEIITTPQIKNHVKKNKPNKKDCKTLICSKELDIFIRNFFKRLTQTYREIFDNYVVMHENDSDIDISDSLKTLLRLIKKDIDKEANIILDKSSEIRNLVSDRTPSKIKPLKRFIDKSIDSINDLIGTTLSAKLRHLSPKIKEIVHGDLVNTAKIELGSLRVKIKDGICDAFSTCNGVDKARKHNEDVVEDESDTIKFKFNFQFDEPMAAIFNLLNRRANNNASGHNEILNLVSKVNNALNGLDKNVSKSMELNGIDAKKIEDVMISEPLVNFTRTTSKEYFHMIKTTISAVNDSVDNTQMKKNVSKFLVV